MHNPYPNTNRSGSQRCGNRETDSAPEGETRTRPQGRRMIDDDIGLRYSGFEFSIGPKLHKGRGYAKGLAPRFSRQHHLLSCTGLEPAAWGHAKPYIGLPRE